MNLQTPIQLYNGKKDNTGSETTLDACIQCLTALSMQVPVAKLHRLKNELAELKSKIASTPEADLPALEKKISKQQDICDAHKGSLPAVTWSGSFNKRLAKELKQYSGLICLDIDDIYNVVEAKEKFAQWPYTFLCFVSPSSAGLKVIVKIDAKPEQHKDYFLALEALIKKEFQIQIDKSGKDICRLCFLSYDPKMVYNVKSTVFSHHVEQPETIKEVKLNKEQRTALQNTDEDLYSVIHFTDKYATYAQGTRNNYVHLFACNANRKGFDLDTTLSFSLGHFSDMNESELRATVKSAFQHNTHEHGKFSKKNSAANKNRSVKENHQVANTKRYTENGIGEFTQFWTERKIKKGKEPYVFEIINYDLLRVEFTDFLFEQGFHLLATNGGGYQLCFSHDGIIQPIEPWYIKNAIFKWCRQYLVKNIEEMLRTKQKQLFSMNELDALHFKHIEFKKDTEEESYFYFKNCWVAVTKDGITTQSYSQLQHYIWAGNKKEHEFTPVEVKIIDTNNPQRLSAEAMNCEFAQFVFYASWNPDGEEKEFTNQQIDQRFLSFCSSIGFMLDGYKHPAYRKSIFALDHKIADRNEKNGRSGKSMIPKACSYLKVSCTINGKTFDPRYTFRYEPITADAQIVNFNDMRQNFDVEEIFEVIADNYSVVRRNNGYINFEYENSPKVYYSANGVPKGEGGSYRARMHMIEFSDYFNPDYTPYDKFGHGFFSSAWDQDEWNRFYNFLLWCVQVYKNDGLVEYPNSNVDARRMAIEVNTEFVDWMDSDIVKRDHRYKKMELLEEYNKLHSQLYSSKLKPHTFFKWLKQYCKNKGLFLNPHKAGHYDKSNGQEYYTIATTETFNPENSQTNLFNK